MIEQNKLKIATLNCRGLRKSKQKLKRQLFIRHLRSLGYDVLILQETHAETPEIIQDLNFLFKTTSSHWTYHCGIVILNTKYSLDVVQDGIDEGRFILARIKLGTPTVDDTISCPTIVTVLNIYGRSQLHTQRSAYFSELINIPVVLDTLTNPDRSPVLVMGDFNYSYEKHRRSDGSLSSAPTSWTSILDNNFVDCFKNQKHVTWAHGTSSSIIDFIFCDAASHFKVDDLEQSHISHSWTDHDLLGISFQYSDPTRRGPGAWKANPVLAKSKTFRSSLAQHLAQQQPTVDAISSTSTPQHTWDWIKANVKQYTRSYQLAENNWRAKELKRLQSKRNMMIRQSKLRGLYYQVLDSINTQIGALQESIAEIQALKGGKQWREKGEKDAGYIKRTATIREKQRSLTALIDPGTGDVYDDQPNKLRIAQEYYTSLFSPDPVEPTVIQELLSAIPTDLRLDADDRDLLTSEIDFDDILEVLKSSPRLSSPGSDGIPFEILNLVMRFPPYKTLILKVFNDALENAEFPASWNESIMTLLKKKGDSKAITNYRPLSLANCDYKCFTKVLNRRMMSVSPKLISASQIGFIPGKYIAENGLRCQVIMEDAERRWYIAAQSNSVASLDKDIGLLLDQEKAYDRVNLSYFRAVLNRFGFPASIVQCIYNLMALNQIRINVNGYFTAAVPKLRGFKQGDPLSCICYDLAFEPFLQSILQDPDFHGYHLKPDHLPVDTSPVTTKILCYADDALVFVHDRQDLRLLKYYMDLFCRASNARFNYSKVDAFSISGRDTRPFWSRHLQDMNIPHLHTVRDPDPLIYLGFPLIQCTQQRSNFVATFVRKLKRGLLVHNGRSLSVVGRATVVNTLLLSKCWYILRVLPLTKQDLERIQAVATQFLKQGIFPAIPWSTWTLPRHQGGLGILDVQVQYAALSFRWVQSLLTFDSQQRDPSPLLAMLSLHINNQHRTAHHQLPLLLPTARRSFTKLRRTSTVDMLYRSIDMLPRDYDPVVINVATGLQLPLLTIIYTTSHSTYKFPLRFSTMTVGDVFQQHQTMPFLHWKDPADPSVLPLKRAPHQLIQGLERGNIHMQPFFRSLCDPASTITTSSTSVSFRPFADQLLSTLGLSDPTVRCSSRTFREAVTSSIIAPSHLSAIAPSAWTFFWSLSLTMVQRNVLYRYINTRIPHMSLLHRIFPLIHLSPMCIICSATVDSVDHFLFSCAPKATVWQNIISEFLWPTVDITDIQHSLLTMDFYNIRYSQKPEAPSHLIVMVTLANIWKAHYRLVFHQQPLLPSSILRSIRLDIQRKIDEDAVYRSL